MSAVDTTVGHGIASAPDEERAVDRPRLLVVDDDHRLLDVLTTLLAHTYEVTLVHGGAAVLMIRPENFDVILIDMDMRRIDGESLKRSFDARGAATPTVMMSGDPENVIRAARAGADGFIGKPFSIADLEAALRVALTRR